MIFQDKKFYLITKNDDVKQYNNLYYYCNNHRTTKLSDQVDKNGNKTRINICDSKIKYEKDTNRYIFCQDHSDQCNELDNAKITNIVEIEKEISNYQNFTDSLKEYLKLNPVITFNDFKRMGQNLYNENLLNFNVGNNFYSNIYYNWRKNSNAYTKFSIFDNQLTIGGTQLLRDYNLTMVYNKSNKSMFQHEYIIFISDYFIKKLNTAKHFYIDGTFVYPKDFKQLIVILYVDENLNKKFPGLFALINNKKEEGYYILFKKIYYILSIEETKDLLLKSYTTDFEIGLINALSKIFQNRRAVGCFYHYTRALRDKARELGLLHKDLETQTKNLLNVLYLAPFRYNNDKNLLNSTCEIYKEKGDNYKNYINYFKTQWMKYFNNGMLNYSKLKKIERSNSYIENYNRRIKLKLSKFLYGKNRCKITWPIFLYFIKNEENDTKNDIKQLENQIENKGKKNSKKEIHSSNNKGQYEKNNLNRKKNVFQFIGNRNWLKYNNFSCRHDTFFLIYAFVIYDKLKDYDKEDSIKYYNLITKDLLKMTLPELNSGIWNLLNKQQFKNFNLKEYGYKQFFSIMQHIENFKNQEFFCIKYSLIEGCSNLNCTKTLIKEEYFSPSINFNEEYWIQYDIPNFLDYLFRNINSYCVKCQWKDGLSDQKTLPKYFKNFTNIITPLFLFISFEDNLNANFDKFLISDIKITEFKLNSLLFNKLRENIDYIRKIIVEEFKYYNIIYRLRGIISMPSNDHYTATLVNIQTESFSIEKGKSYYYNDNSNNNEIVPLEDWKVILNDEIPVLILYQKVE